MSRIAKSDGFSTVELLVVLIVIGIVFGAFVTTFVSIQNINKKAADIQIANGLAFEKIQQYENTVFTNITATTPSGTLVEVEDFSNDMPEFLALPRVAKVYVNTVSPTLKHIVVSVSYGSGGAQLDLQYATFIQKNGLGQ
jgi:type II secretory pathway pseudopilin PulG